MYVHPFLFFIGFNEVNLKKCTNRPFLLVPYAHSMYDVPPLSELEYMDEFGFIHYGKFIRIGRVDELRKSPECNSRVSYARIAVDAWASTMQSNKIFIQVDP